ncbi:MAG: hypothetical protein QOF48_2947 [Verrucomicrobiota bacterium]|jgi:hypothetical protein
MKTKMFLVPAMILAFVLAALPMKAQSVFFDCSCLATQSVLITNACQAVIPDLCKFTVCVQSTVVPPPSYSCSQSPTAGSPVGPGNYPITVTILDSQGLASQCTVTFKVLSPATGPFALLCAANKTVECGTTWTFNPPTPTNACCPHPGTPNGGVTITMVGTTTNGTCPRIYTRTWNAVDDCGATATCSQKVTVVDTTPPLLDCSCLRNPAVVQLTVTGCSNTIPDLCLLASSCASDNCGPLNCTQTPAPGTVVFPGAHPITVTISDCATNTASCVVVFTVNPPAGGCLPPCLPQARVWNTGMGGAAGNVLLGAGVADPNYTLVSQPPGGCTGPAQVINTNTIPAPPWLGTGPISQWIGAGPTAYCQGGVYHFQLCFYLPCTDGASITGRWSADDWAELRLNGQVTGHQVPSTQFPNVSFAGWHPVTLTNGFVCGSNCLDFYVTNAYTFDNPTGLRAELTNVFNDCCCGTPQTVFSVYSGEGPGGALPAGASDTQFALSCAPVGVPTGTPVVVTPHPLWLPNGPNSQWIGPDPSTFGPGGTYCYTLRFSLPPCPSGNPRYSVNGQWMADDTGTIYLNGNPTGNTLPNGWAFTNWHPFSITSGLLPGLNTLTFYVTNASAGPTGLRLELTASASCCACTPIPCSCSLTNGDFGQPVPVNGTGGGWTASGLFFGAGWQSSGGNPGGTFLLNNVGDPATDPMIAQTVCCLVPGQCYTIRGQRKVQAWFGDSSPSFSVLVNGSAILTLPVPTIPPDTNWYDFSVSFTASSTCQTIGFAAEINGTDVSYWLDNLRLDCCDPNCAVSVNCPTNRVLLTCSNSAVGYYTATAAGNNGPVICSPPSGTAFPLGTNYVICTATNNCGATASCYFSIAVKLPSPRWSCAQISLGLPTTPLGSAHVTALPNPNGTGPDRICYYNLGSSGQDGVEISLGSTKKFTFTTELDFGAPEGAHVDISLPADPAHPTGTPLLSFRSKGPKGYCVKSAKRFTDDAAASYRSIAIGTNGDLFPSFVWDGENMDTNVLLNINHLPGVTSVVMTVTLDCRTREVSIDMAHCLWTPDASRKGWDGCIYGNRPPGSLAGRLILTPLTTVVSPPITALQLRAAGVPQLAFEEPALTVAGRKWGDGHVTLMKAYDDGESLEFMAVGNGGGVHVDLGHSSAFDLRLQKFETNAIPGEELLTRTIGPIRGLTNRPPPPFLDAMLFHASTGGVDCSADFTGLDSPTVRILIKNNGALVAQRTGVPAQLGQTLFTLPSWPVGLGKLGGASPCRTGKIKIGTIRFPGGAGFQPASDVEGDEFLVLAELPAGAPHPDYYTAFEFIATENADWGLTGLQRTLACASAPLSIARNPAGVTVNWSSEGSRLQGAEFVRGPWYDLGPAAPVTIPSDHSARFLRLICD